MTELWESPFFGVTLTILAYRLGCGIQKKTGLVICNGLVLADLMIIAVLLVFRIPYEAYNAGGSLINLFLGPATVCLAVTIYSQIDLLKRHLLPILAGCAVAAQALFRDQPEDLRVTLRYGVIYGNIGFMGIPMARNALASRSAKAGICSTGT